MGVEYMQRGKVNPMETRTPYQHSIPLLNEVAELDTQLTTTGIWSFLSLLPWVYIFVSFLNPKANTNTRKLFNLFNKAVKLLCLIYCLPPQATIFNKWHWCKKFLQEIVNIITVISRQLKCQFQMKTEKANLACLWVSSSSCFFGSPNTWIYKNHWPLKAKSNFSTGPTIILLKYVSISVTCVHSNTL